MLTKIFSLALEKIKKISSSEEVPVDVNVLEDPVFEFVVQIDGNGDFAIGSECFSTEEEHSTFLGMTLYLLNAGLLSDYFVEAMRLCAEGDESKMKFILNAMQCWKDVYDREAAASSSSSKDAVEPKDVFSFYTMRP